MAFSDDKAKGVMKSISGGLAGSGLKNLSKRPAMSKTPTAKAVGRLTGMGFGKRRQA